jgi:3-hydroxyacyl-[acyl-carrier-protein] dehydratase
MVQAEIRLNPGHHVYRGHFPGQPVVPGVLQLQMVKEILETALQENLRLNEMGSVKYLKLIVPNQFPLLTCQLTYRIIEEGWKISADLKSDEVVCTKIRANLTAI